MKKLINTIAVLYIAQVIALVYYLICLIWVADKFQCFQKAATVIAIMIGTHLIFWFLDKKYNKHGIPQKGSEQN